MGETAILRGIGARAVLHLVSGGIFNFDRKMEMSVPRAGVVQQNVSLVDLFPTLCDLVNVPAPEGLDGRSLVPIMEGQTDGWENEAYSELHTHQHGPSVMVKQDDLKYFRFEGKGWPEQLFDLAADPDENRNLIDDKTPMQTI